MDSSTHVAAKTVWPHAELYLRGDMRFRDLKYAYALNVLFVAAQLQSEKAIDYCSSTLHV